MNGEMISEPSTSFHGNDREETVVSDCGRRRSSCGYCKSLGRTSVSHGLWAKSITVNDYQDLVDRGWRRSGCFLYKPEMETTCCPSYTIRLKADDFTPSKEQLRVLKKVQRFLDARTEIKNPGESAAESSNSMSAATHAPQGEYHVEGRAKDQHITECLSAEVDKAVHKWVEGGDLQFTFPLPKSSVKRVPEARRKLSVEGGEDLLYTSNIAFQIAAAIKREKISDKNPCCIDANGHISHKKIAENIASALNKSDERCGFTVRSCNGHVNFYATVSQASHFRSSYSKARTCLMEKPDIPPPKRRELRIILKQSSFDPEEFALYRKYQIKVHNDMPEHVSESSYRRFLVDTPLIFTAPSDGAGVAPCGFGSFHQQYLIDDQLVAVGVIDILPKCLSSKYLFWDPDFGFLSLGKYSALQELNWVKEVQVHSPSLQYYYLGYYIHSCSKMRYKAAYRPSELLCPLRYQWVPYNIALPALEKSSYVILSDLLLASHDDNLRYSTKQHANDFQLDGDYAENDTIMEHNDEALDASLGSSESDDETNMDADGSFLEMENNDIGDILIGIKNSRLRYKDLIRFLSPRERVSLEMQLFKYSKVVGSELAKKMVYALD